jgi:drug/metabolite transporter (DMT)-like permease
MSDTTLVAALIGVLVLVTLGMGVGIVRLEARSTGWRPLPLLLSIAGVIGLIGGAVASGVERPRLGAALAVVGALCLGAGRWVARRLPRR